MNAAIGEPAIGEPAIGERILCPALAMADPGFRAWFGSSRAVDARGLPLLLHHGCEARFRAFDPGRIDRRSSRPAFWFSSHAACGWYGPRRVAVYLRAPRVFEAPDGDLTRWVRRARTENLEVALAERETSAWDAVVFRDVVDGDMPADVWAVFEADSLKSPAAARFDREDPDLFA